MSTTQRSRVVVHSKLTAVSSRPVKAGTTHNLTALDHAMGLHTLHVVFYYKHKLLGCFDLDPLRLSLSEALSLHPPVMGRMAQKPDGNWEVKCNDAGVRVYMARVATTLDQWLRSADGSEERLLTVWDDMPDDPSIWSPYRIQINEFEGGGAAIGVSCTHMHADPTCVTLLVKAWAETHRKQAIAHPLLVGESSALGGRPVDQDIIKTKSAAAYYEAKSVAAKTPLPEKKMSTATFKFSSAMIEQGLLQIHKTCPEANPFDLLAALFWTSIARLKPPKSATKHSLSICTDSRKKLCSGWHYGNALHFSMLSVPDVEEVENANGLEHVAEAVHRHVWSQNEEEFWSGVDWFGSQKGEEGKFGAAFRMYGPELTCVSMEHMNDKEPLMYAAMFDKDKKPAHVSYRVGNVEGEGFIMVMPASGGGLGRMVMVTLPEEELGQLCVAQPILSLKPTMLLSGKQA
ncbi:PREDICTED: protein ECERIFERUM 26-like [Prunus mume]|uniref:Protein ECERIFERUM 26-like n=1 Tax=Prunus mume TaxID=102107 RepID=A0ABM0N1T1_PRUMU|nr:PREDICTED: protein ECERIFERUM 26-like [Prunus mume]